LGFDFDFEFRFLKIKDMNMEGTPPLAGRALPNLINAVGMLKSKSKPRGRCRVSAPVGAGRLYRAVQAGCIGRCRAVVSGGAGRLIRACVVVNVGAENFQPLRRT
jgi:hypothetical protein